MGRKGSKPNNPTAEADTAAPQTAAAVPQTSGTTETVSKPAATAVPQTMKAVRLTKPNMEHPGGEGSALDSVPVPNPGAGVYLVQMKLRPCNPADVFSFAGVYQGVPDPAQWPAKPITPGLEGMGVVVATGPGADKFTSGQRVCVAGLPAERGNGTWAEYVAFKEDEITAVPDAVTDAEAAQFWVNPVTAVGMITELHLSEGDYVIFAAAGSTLCRMAIHYAKSKGYKTIGTVRRDEQREEIIAHGADYCISTASEDVVKRVHEITGGKGASGAIDSVGGSCTGELVSSLKRGGTVLVYGAMSGIECTLPLMDLLFKGIAVKGFWLTIYTTQMSKSERSKFIETVMGLIEQKTIQPGSHVGTVYPLAQYGKAIEESNKPGRGGKVFLES